MSRQRQPDPPGDRLAAALAEHRAGRLDAAADGYRAVLDVDPGDAAALHFSGVIALQRGDPATAETTIRKAIAQRPRDAAMKANLGLALMALERHDEAAAALREAVTLAPGHVDGWYNLGLACQAGGNRRAAIDAFRHAVNGDRGHWQAVAALATLLTRDGQPLQAIEAVAAASGDVLAHADVHRALSDAYRCDGSSGPALHHARQAVALAGDDGEAHAALSALHRQAGDTAAALASARDAVRVAPDLPAAHRSLGLACRTAGDLDGACNAFARYLELGRAPGRPVDAGLATYTQSSLSKLRHDAEQLDYLEQHGMLPNGCEGLAAALLGIHQRAAQRLPASHRARVFTLPVTEQKRVSGRYNRLHRWQPAPYQPGGALGSGVAAHDVERRYHARAPGIVWIDRFLSAAALDALRRFCLESTIWFDFDHNNGYLGAYFEEGFFCPLLLQIADELRLALPGIFGTHPLMQMWAYKYDSDLSGIDLHADFAAVNVNFWITPDSANRDPASGGLVIHDVKAPRGQAFAEYNSSEPGAQAKIRAYLDMNGAAEVTVPYRENRAVIFHSDLYHRTDTIRFRSGYTNRRINVTMLFGRRDAG